MFAEFADMADEELAALAKEGSQDAVDMLLDRYKDMVSSKAGLYFMLGAEQGDVAQEGMIGLFKAVRMYDPSKGASFRTFADVCVNRQIITAIKSAARKKYNPLNQAYSLDRPSGEGGEQTLGETLAAGMESNPEAAVIFAEMTDLIMSEESDFLSGFEHEVLRGIYAGKGYRQIAEELGRQPKSVDNAIQRIRSKLKVFFSE